MFAVLWLVSLLCTSSLAQIFEFADLDALSDIWHNRYNELNNIRYETCTANVLGERITGLCKPKVDCMLSGGTPRGACGILSTCCTYERSCGRSTNSRISYFTSTGNFNGSLCSYRVNLMNDNICQIRLDFLEFDLLPATDRNSKFQCITETFYADPNSFEPMCGTNQGQHLYIHLARSIRQVTLHVRRTRVESRWNVRVTQLECGRSGNRNGRRENSWNYALLAPPGCLQYYTEASGTFKSFGYSGPYVPNQYSICFRRTPDICGVRFLPQEIALSGMPNFCGDSLSVHNGVRRCHDETTAFELNQQGPLYILFTATNARDTQFPDPKFRVNYELIPCR